MSLNELLSPFDNYMLLLLSSDKNKGQKNISESIPNRFKKDDNEDEVQYYDCTMSYFMYMRDFYALYYDLTT